MYICERESVFYEPANVSVSAFVVCLYICAAFDVYACTSPLGLFPLTDKDIPVEALSAIWCMTPLAFNRFHLSLYTPTLIWLSQGMMYSNAHCHFDVQPTSKSWLTTDDQWYRSMNMYLLGNCASFNSYCSTIAKASFCHYSQAFEHQPTLIIPDLTSSLLRLHCWPHSQTPSRRYYQEIDERWFTLVTICRSRYLVVHSLSVSTVHKQRANMKRCTLFCFFLALS